MTRDLGHITGALAITMGAAALLAGNLADKIGFRVVVILSMALFSMLAGLSGLAVGVGSMVIFRALMGLAEGAFVPASIVAILDASTPDRHGFNVGVQQTMPALLGLGVTPIAVTQLLQIVNWRWIFLLVAFPGVAVAMLSASVLRKSPAAPSGNSVHDDLGPHRWHHALQYRNVRLAILSMLCWLSCNIVIAALFPSYLTDYLGLNVQQMGFVVSALGFGGALGSLTVPPLSDRLGRKLVMVLAVVAALAALFALVRSGPNVVALFGLLGLVSGLVLSLMALTIGPVSAGAVPSGLRSTASGLVIGIGEIFGGGVAPSLAGFGAKHFGIGHVLYMPIGALCCGLVAVALLDETSAQLSPRDGEFTLGAS